MVKEEWEVTRTVKDTLEYSQIDYIHLVNLKFLLQSIQVLELSPGEVDGILSFINGQKDTRNVLVKLKVKAKLAILTRFFCEKSA